MPKNRCPLVAASTLLVALTSNVLAQDAVQWRVEDGGNGHWYQLVISETDSELAWSTAESAARATGGHLATVANEDENEFIFSVADQINAWWIVADNPIDYCIGPWLGGTDEAEEGTWSWVTGEEWDWTNWWTGEPNNGCNGEDYLSFLTQGDIVPSSNWNDGGGECGPWPKSYVVEWSADCNGDGIVDYGQILDGTLTDTDGDGVPDCCENGTCLEPIQWRIEDGGNGHWYLGASSDEILQWTEAVQLAESAGGHLATLATTDEDWWVKNNIAKFDFLWSGANGPGGFVTGPLFGGFRLAEGTWGWLDGTPWLEDQANWFPGNPDSPASTDSGLLYWERDRSDSGWQDFDIPTQSLSATYLIEWSADCNDDGIVDYGQILDGTLTDSDGNGIPDTCEVEFSGFEVVPSTNGDYTVIDIHAVYNLPSVNVLNMFERSILTKDGQGFHHSDLSTLTEAPGSWSPLLSLDIPGTDVNSEIDSFVTLGGGVGTSEEIAANNTALDPGFEEGSGPLVPVGSGWYDGNPKTPEMVEAFAGGYHGLSGFSVFVGRFVVETARINDYSDPTSFFTFNGESGAERTKNEDKEIIFGTGSVAFPDDRDCDGNGTSDWIELANGSATDCNGNFIPDACEIADGMLTDTDGDGIPDVCDPCPSWPGACSEDGQTLFVVAGESIQQAVDICAEGGTVSIGPGTFTGEGSSVITLAQRPMTVIGALESTIIDGQGMMRGLMGDSPLSDGTTIEGLTFTNCWATGGQDATGTGGGLYLNGVSASIRLCTFHNNLSKLHGGGMCVFDATVEVDSCIFTNNSTVDAGQNGGGLYFDGDQDEITVTNCEFTANSATAQGGAFGVWEGSASLSESMMAENSARGGGAFWHRGIGAFTVGECTFSANNATEDAENSGGGGAIFCQSGAQGTVSNCTFSTNIAITYGGAIRCMGSTVTIEQSDFTNNESAGGGAIMNGSSNVTLTDNTFDGNTSSIDGGGILNLFSTVMTASNCTFTNNVAEDVGLANARGGGAIQLGISSSATIDQSNFNNNATGAIGGAIAISANSTLTLTNSALNENHGFDGGAIAFYTGSSGDFTNVQFNQNTSDLSGGGLQLSNSSASLTTCQFAGNTAWLGGGMAQTGSGSSSTLTDCQFDFNNAIGGKGDGGGFYASTCEGGSNQSNMTNCSFIGNSSEWRGGGLSVHCQASVTLDQCNVSENTAEGPGDGIVNPDSPLSLLNTTVCSNGAMINDIDGGHDHTIALLSNGQVLCWGSNHDGQCDVPEELFDPNNPAIDVAAGSWHSVAIRADGTLVCWGADNYGQSSPPLNLTDGSRRVVHVAPGEQHTLALTDDGVLWAWGRNDSGQCDIPSGVGTSSNPALTCESGTYHSLAIVGDGDLVAWGYNAHEQTDVPEDIAPGGTGPRVVAMAGSYHTVALLEDGSIRCWGLNGNGQCTIPEGIGASDQSVRTVRVAAYKTLVELEDNRVICWGSGGPFDGQCNIPGEVSIPDAPLQQFQDGAYHSIAVLDDGSLVMWGSNANGQITAPASIGNDTQISGIYTDLGGSCVTAVCDSDGDGTLDCFDGCPDDPDQTEPGPCGCAGSEIDTDGDGIPDCIDPCPTWPGDCSEDGQTLFVGSDDGADAIQLALTIIPEGGTISVGPGTYAGPIDFAGKAVTLEAKPDRQAGPAGEVILDGTGLDGSIVLAITGEGPDTVLRGFVLQNGITGTDPIAPENWDYTVGGALYVHQSSPTIEGCVFRNCAAGSAGAAFFFLSDSVLSDCIFLDNVSGRTGGGLQLQRSNLIVEDCVFTGNQATYLGGAIHNWKGSPSFIRCTITDNTAFTAGGGMSFFWNSTAKGNAIIEDCVITRNVAQVEGGGLMLSTDEGITPDWLLVGNTTLCNNTPENTNPNAGAPFVDLGGNQICGCPGDVNFDAQVDGQDLAVLLSNWGACTSDDPTACFADINGDGVVGGPDLTIILSSWGVCVN